MTNAIWILRVRGLAEKYWYWTDFILNFLLNTKRHLSPSRRNIDNALLSIFIVALVVEWNHFELVDYYLIDISLCSKITLQLWVTTEVVWTLMGGITEMPFWWAILFRGIAKCSQRLITHEQSLNKTKLINCLLGKNKPLIDDLIIGITSPATCYLLTILPPWLVSYVTDLIKYTFQRVIPILRVAKR